MADGRDPDETRDLSATETANDDASTTERIGNFVVLQKVGEGGMGEVYEAEQTEPVRRRVALKVIKRGMDTKQVIARFEAERQALALMDHPAVAKVFEAGSTPRGRPYFVMEFVRGVPITAHCDRHRLSTRARLELFLEVCDGVQHAHQKAIIHRDLKPSNVLVSVQDGEATPKIIDFGVAKATTQRLTEKTVYTELGVLIGTPEYMSPEQAEMTGQNVDTRTDVYALGVMLYELLTGALPFERDELRSGGYESIQRVLREKEPPRPSTRLDTLGGERLTRRAQRRGVDASGLRRQLTGDLDWITMKALEKDRTRRYGSPAELAADIRRHLEDQPVLAGPPSATYRAGKFVRRHKIGVGLAAAGLVLLIGFAGAMATVAKRIADERDRADAAATLARKEATTATRVSRLMVDLFARANPGEARGNEVTVRQVLDKGADQVVAELGDEPEVQVELLTTIGESYRALASWQRAESLLAQALEKAVAVHGAGSPEVARIKVQLAHVLVWAGDFDRAEALNREALATYRAVLGNDDPAVAEAINILAFNFVRSERNLDEGEGLLREALAIQRKALGEEHLDTALTLANLGWIMNGPSQREESERVFRRSLEIRRKLYGGDHPEIAYTLQRLAGKVLTSTDPDAALKMFHEALAMNRRLYGDKHPEIAYNLNSIGVIYVRRQEYENAREWIEAGLAMRRELLAPDNSELARSLESYGFLLIQLGDYEAAQRTYEEALEILRRVFGDSNRQVGDVLSNLAWVTRARGDLQRAYEVSTESLAIQRELRSADDPMLLYPLANLANVVRELGDSAAAEPLLREAYDLGLAGMADRDDPYVTQAYLARVLIDLGRIEEACLEAETAVSKLNEVIGVDNFYAVHALSVRGNCYAHRGDFARAETDLTAAYRKMTELRAPGDSFRVESLRYLIDFYERTGRTAEAAELSGELARTKPP